MNGMCPGAHQHQLQECFDETCLEACKAYTMFHVCQHTFECECRDYAKGNDCKQILLGKETSSKIDLMRHHSRAYLGPFGEMRLSILAIFKMKLLTDTKPRACHQEIPQITYGMNFCINVLKMQNFFKKFKKRPQKGMREKLTC